MAESHIAAAARSGIGLTLLPGLYRHGGIQPDDDARAEEGAGKIRACTAPMPPPGRKFVNQRPKMPKSQEKAK